MTEQQPEPYRFPIPGNIRKDCAECGQRFRGREEEPLCLECSYKKDHPEARDMYWTWRQGAFRRWDIVAYWPDDHPFPEPGEQVTVHRKDGSTSAVTIQEVEGLTFTYTGRGQLRCTTK